MTSHLKHIREICVDVAGIDESKCDQATAQRITEIASTIPLFPDQMKEPKKIEREVDQIIGDIRSLRKRIASLDGDAMSYARRAATRAERDAIDNAICAAGGNEEAMDRAIRQYESFSKRPQTEWVDFAALAHIDALEAAMRKLGAQAISKAPPGAGRPKNRHAHDVAFAAAKAFTELTGEQPGFWNDGSTPFTRMVQKLFDELGIKVRLRGPIEAAMQKLTSSD